MAVKNNLGDRMKGYEQISKHALIHRMPVIIRLDGNAFHTFTRGFKKPFDEVFSKSMQETMQHLCENIAGCVFGYTQSDEITLVLVDYQTYSTSAWFDNEIQKICSISASMATLAFNKYFKNNVCKVADSSADFILTTIYNNAIAKGGMFDSRCFNIPKEEVANCLIWRQQDAVRNSIQATAQCNFSHAQLQHKNCDQLQEMLFQEKGINWNNTPTKFKRGSCCIKQFDEIKNRNKWVIDNEIPIFTQDRNYIEKYIIFD